MKLYIDIEHFRSLAMSASNEHWKECTEMLQHDCDIMLTAAKNDLMNGCKKNVANAVGMLLTLLQRNRGKSEKVEENASLPSTFNPSACENLTSLYFVEQSDVIPKGLICPPIGSEVKALTSLYVGNRYIPTKKYLVPEMRDWSIIENDSNSCTDIIITDRYLFAQSDLQYEKNAYNLVCSLCENCTGEVINVVIFTLNSYKDESLESHDIPLTTIQRQLKERVKKVTEKEIKLTIVLLPISDAHDRKIFTNYKSFSSGPSYSNYFKDGTEYSTSNGLDLYSNTHIDRENYRIAQYEIKYLQDIVDKRKSGINSIIGDKESNFLNFS